MQESVVKLVALDGAIRVTDEEESFFELSPSKAAGTCVIKGSDGSLKLLLPLKAASMHANEGFMGSLDDIPSA